MTEFRTPGYDGVEGTEWRRPPVCPVCETRDHYPPGPGGVPACQPNGHEWKHHQCVRCAVLRESPNALSPCDAVVEKASEVAS